MSYFPAMSKQTPHPASLLKRKRAPDSDETEREIKSIRRFGEQQNGLHCTGEKSKYFQDKQQDVPKPIEEKSIQLSDRQQDVLNSTEEKDPYFADKQSILKLAEEKGIQLSDEQQNVLKLAAEKESFFFTGAAGKPYIFFFFSLDAPTQSIFTGTGKSLALRSKYDSTASRLYRWIILTYTSVIIEWLKNKYVSGGVAVTAPTGIAACNIGGCTLHSFAGVGLGQGPLSSLIKKVGKRRKTVERWQNTTVLVIDESKYNYL